MSNLQALHVGGAGGASLAASDGSTGFFKDPREMKWLRTDWVGPVGAFGLMVRRFRETRVRGLLCSWQLVAIPELYLYRKAALLLLQGQSLSHILLPNHEIRLCCGDSGLRVHLLLRVDPWLCWEPVPLLRNVVLARLLDVPKELSNEEILAALAQDALDPGSHSG